MIEPDGVLNDFGRESMIEPDGVLNDFGRESMTFVLIIGCTHSDIVAQTPLICQYLRTSPKLTGKNRKFSFIVNERRMAALPWRSQPIDATHSLNFSAGE